MDTFFTKLSLPSGLASRPPLILTWSFLTFLLRPSQRHRPWHRPFPFSVLPKAVSSFPKLCRWAVSPKCSAFFLYWDFYRMY